MKRRQLVESWISKCRSELHTLIALILLPAMLGVLPWPVGFRVARQLSRWQWLYAAEWRAALDQAQHWVEISDPSGWAHRYRFTRLVDHLDYLRSRLLSRATILRQIDVLTPWPEVAGTAMGGFFHWGANFPFVHALRARGVDSCVLAGRVSTRGMGGAWLGFLYGHIRLRELARVSGGPLIYAPRTVQQSLDALQAGRWVIGTPDVPPSETRMSVPVQLFGRTGYMPEGLLLIARKAGVPVVIFTLGLDFDTGRRDLRIFGPFDANDPGLMQRIADTWEGLIREKSWGFTLWPAMPAFFATPAGGADTQVLAQRPPRSLPAL